MLTKDELKTNIKTLVAAATEVNPVTHNPDNTLDNACTAIIKTFTDNTYPNTKQRLDGLESDFNTLITSLTSMGAAFTATGTAPVTGATLGAAITAIATALTALEVARTAAKAVQEALPKPYLDGVKS